MPTRTCDLCSDEHEIDSVRGLRYYRKWKAYLCCPCADYRQGVEDGRSMERDELVSWLTNNDFHAVDLGLSDTLLYHVTQTRFELARRIINREKDSND